MVNVLLLYFKTVTDLYQNLKKQEHFPTISPRDMEHSTLVAQLGKCCLLSLRTQ